MQPGLETDNQSKMVDQGLPIPDSFWNSLLSSGNQVSPSLEDNERLTELGFNAALPAMSLPMSIEDPAPETPALEAPAAEKLDDPLVARENCEGLDPESLVPKENVVNGTCSAGEHAQDSESSKLLDKALRSMSAQLRTQPPPEAIEGLAFFITQAMSSFCAEIDWIDTLFQTSQMIKAQRDSKHVAFSLESTPSVPDQETIGGFPAPTKRRAEDAGKLDTIDSHLAIPKKLNFRRKSAMKAPKTAERSYSRTRRFSRTKRMMDSEDDDSDIEVIACTKKPALRCPSQSPPALPPRPAIGHSSQLSHASSSGGLRCSDLRAISASTPQSGLPASSSKTCLASTSRLPASAPKASLASNSTGLQVSPPTNVLGSTSSGLSALDKRGLLLRASKGASSSALRSLRSSYQLSSIMKQSKKSSSE